MRNGKSLFCAAKKTFALASGTNKAVLCTNVSMSTPTRQSGWIVQAESDFAIGGLPIPLIEGERAKEFVAAVTQRLWTPLGLRSLAPEAPGYAPRLKAVCESATSVYHQGTVWPWLIGRSSRPGCVLMARATTLSATLEHVSSCR